MTLTFSAPGKTFLIGEYAALVGGPALMLNTRPRFELRVTRGTTEVIGIPPGSPSHRWLEARRPLLDGYRLEFVDPHAGAGGFGASGAQFLCVHAFTTFLQHSFARILDDGFNLGDVFRDHLALSARGGSGADVLAQATGGVAEVDVATASARARDWAYPELGFALVRTHQKISTHEHVRGLDRDQLTLLVRPAREAVTAYGSAPVEVFIGKLNEFTGALAELGLRAPATANLLARFQSEPWCLSAKGCGALGADVVAILHPREDHEKVRSFVKKLSLNVLATDRDLTPGLEMKWL